MKLYIIDYNSKEILQKYTLKEDLRKFRLDGKIFLHRIKRDKVLVDFILLTNKYIKSINYKVIDKNSVYEIDIPKLKR